MGSNTAGEYIYRKAAENWKRAQVNMGAKNHGVVLPDANPAAVVNALAGASCGAAGQRCMALSVAVFVGNAREFIPQIAAAAATLKVGPGHLPGTDTGPVISKAKKEHIEKMIQGAVDQGAEILLDGRNPTLELGGEDPAKYKDGFYVGPTVLRGVTPDMECYIKINLNAKLKI